MNQTGGLKVQGMRWQSPGVMQALPPSALASNVLCDRHNSSLSCLDSQAARLFDAFHQTAADFAGVSPQRALDRVFLFNGHDIERWMLKVLCGLVASKMLPLAPDGTAVSVVPEEWLRIAWGRSVMAKPWGLYFLGDPGMVFRTETSTEFVGIFSTDTGALEGMEMRFYGFAFGLGLARRRPFRHETYRPTHLSFEGEGTGIRRLEIAWDYPGDGLGIEIHYSPSPPTQSP